MRLGPVMYFPALVLGALCLPAVAQVDQQGKKFCLCSMVSGTVDSHWILEWVEWHKMMGFNQFYLYKYNWHISGDRSLELIKDYAKNGE